MEEPIFDFDTVEKKIKYKFKNKSLLKTAFTHSSYLQKNAKEVCNERLEFLGDSVLELVVSDYLYKNYDLVEGEMTKCRARLVNTKSLAKIISLLKLEDYLLKNMSVFDVPDSLRADLFESILGAIYLDGGIDKAKAFALKFIDIESGMKATDIDYKTSLQEIVQKYKGSNLVYFTYEIPREPGMFCSEVYVNDVFVAKSTANSKKKAQVECAKIAFNNKQKLKSILENK